MTPHEFQAQQKQRIYNSYNNPEPAPVQEVAAPEVSEEEVMAIVSEMGLPAETIVPGELPVAEVIAPVTE